MRGSTVVAAVLVAALVLPACGGRSCTDVADDFADELQDALDAAGQLTAEDVQASGDTLPPFLQRLADRGEELESEGQQLGCGEEQMDRLLDERIAELEAEPGTPAEELLRSVREVEFFEDAPPDG